jgi:hypothetical protein
MRLLLLLLLTSCITIVPQPKEKTKFVDIQTYKTWGSTHLTPIGTRPLPTQAEIDNNPIWQYGEPDRAYHERQRDEIRKHPGH